MSELLKIEGLSKGFGGKAVLRDVRFALEPGLVYGLLGRNGEGKTTLIRTIMGAIPRDAGFLSFRGRPVTFGDADYKSSIGYIPEDPFFYGNMTVAGLLEFNGRFFPKWDAGRAADDLARFGLDPAARIRTLSRGQKLKLGFAAALAARPELLVLDDPTSGLDVPTRRDFLRDVIRELAAGGTAVLFASHLVHELERIVDHLLVLHGGRIILDEGYEKVRDLARRVGLGFDGEPPGFPDPPNLLGRRQDGRDVELIIYPWNEEIERTLRAAGPERFEVEPLGLEDFFAALVVRDAR
jgi:ABC-2 type transport system ATP-binding protein